eukprot:scaffold668565_cov57-Prasinocladus_malaysianus.AAC.1
MDMNYTGQDLMSSFMQVKQASTAPLVDVALEASRHLQSSAYRSSAILGSCHLRPEGSTDSKARNNQSRLLIVQ